jgi:HAD superfamily hydrolase (TIGR01549 family)
MAIRTIFFDSGGTLLRPTSYEGGADAFRRNLWVRVLAEHGPPRPSSAIQSALEQADRTLGTQIYDYVGRVDDFWHRLNDRVMDQLNVPGNREGIQQALEGAFRNASLGEPYPEVRDVLEELRRRGFHLGVISNHNDALIRILRHHRLSPFFETVTYSQEAGADKPDPRVFQLALRRAASEPDEALHVGDSWEMDVLGARSVGIRPVWVDRSGGRARRGCVRVTNLSELIPHVAGDPAPVTSRRTANP